METQYKIYNPSEIITLIKDNVEGVLKVYLKYGKEMLEHIRSYQMPQSVFDEFLEKLVNTIKNL